MGPTEESLGLDRILVEAPMFALRRAFAKVDCVAALLDYDVWPTEYVISAESLP